MSTETAEYLPKKNMKSSVFTLTDGVLRQYGLAISLLAIALFFQFITGGVLFRPVNLTNLVLQNSYVVVMALGMLLVIVSGHIDLSVGSVVGFIGALAGVLMVDYGLSPYLVVPFCILFGGVIGIAQGFCVAYGNIPSFIVTLSGMLVFKGLALWILDGRSVGPFPVSFQVFSSGFFPDPIGPLVIGSSRFHCTTLILSFFIVAVFLYLMGKKRRNAYAYGLSPEPFTFFAVKAMLIAAIILFFSFLLASYRGFPNVLVLMIILVALFVFLTRRTTFGRRIYAIGGNQKASRLSGVQTRPLTCFVFVIMGMMSALAGLIFAARLNMATPKAGTTMELDVIAAVFIGGASALGGVGNVSGAVIGALIMGVMNNGMSIMGVNIDWQQVIKGLVLLGSVGLDVRNRKGI